MQISEAYAIAMLNKYIGDDRVSTESSFIDRYHVKVIKVGESDDYIGIIRLDPEDGTDEVEYSCYYIHPPTFADEPGQVSILRKKKTEDVIPHILAF